MVITSKLLKIIFQKVIEFIDQVEYNFIRKWYVPEVMADG